MICAAVYWYNGKLEMQLNIIHIDFTFFIPEDEVLFEPIIWEKCKVNNLSTYRIYNNNAITQVNVEVENLTRVQLE